MIGTWEFGKLQLKPHIFMRMEKEEMIVVEKRVSVQKQGNGGVFAKKLSCRVMQVELSSN